MGKKSRRFTIIYTELANAEARLPYEQWYVHSQIGEYTDPEVAREVCRQLEEECTRDQWFCTLRNRWFNHDIYYPQDTPVDARRENRPMYKYIIRGVPPEEDYQSREEDRIAAGEYTPLDKIFQYYTNASFAFLTEDKKISFFDGEEQAKLDRRTVMTASRYLRTRMGWTEARTWDQLEEWGIATQGMTLCFATTRDEIRYVYENGPDSCMAGEAERFNRYDSSTDKIHPTEVYASPDLELAYMKRGDDITARALCNKNTKEYVRIYGDHERFIRLLEAAGYKENPMCLGGVRLLKIFRNPQRTQIYLPFIDGCFTNVEVRADDREYLHIVCKPIILCGTTNGYAELRA